MATRRMFSRTIIETDRFLSLPITSQNLYFHLGMYADDDGFVSSPKAIMEITGTTREDLDRLCDEELIATFSSGVIALIHWRIHNQIRKDRYHETLYREEKAALFASGIVPLMATESRQGKDRKEKESPDKTTDTLEDDRFLSFWKAYPRKENFADAKAAWQEIDITDTLFETILQSVEAQKSSQKWTAEHGKFIPLPANWLRKEAWHDQPTSTATTDDVQWINFIDELA